MRIGLLLNILDEEYQLSIFRGMNKRAKEKGIELICFQRNNVPFNKYSINLPKADFFNLDGLIILTSVVVDKCEVKNIKEVEKVFGKIPVVSVGQAIYGIPSLIIRSESAMTELVTHLVEEHSYRHLVFMSGREKHYDNVVRETVFRNAIEKYKRLIPEITGYVLRGDFSEESAIQAISEHVNQNKNSKIDAIVCANDNMAIGVNKFLKINRPSCVEEKCAVTGFDDTPQAELEISPLTTVRQPMEEIGIRALDMIEAKINGHDLPALDSMEAKFIKRQSCGCPYSKEIEKEADIRQGMNKIQIKYLQSEQRLRMISHIGQDLNSVYSLPELRVYLDRNLEMLGVRNFCIISFIESKRSLNSGVYPLYVRKNGKMEDKYFESRKTPLKTFLKDFFVWDESYAFKYLYLGKDNLGGILYQAKEELHPYICSMSINISQTILRLKVMEEDFKYAENLEKEVQKRTKELVESNVRRAKVEAQVLKISEAERQRFSTDLHDDICQRLAGISMLCKSYWRKPEPVAKEEMAELVELITDTLQRTRQYAHNSYPVELESLGMNHSLNNLCAAFEVQSGIKCKYEWNLQKNLDFNSIQKLNIFRIIQEALHNVMKHSKADTVIVSIDSVKDYVIVDVRDNGIGIPESDANGKKEGLGLNSMQYRADQIGAQFEIKPNLPKGTCVELKIFPQQK